MASSSGTLRSWVAADWFRLSSVDCGWSLVLVGDRFGRDLGVLFTACRWMLSRPIDGLALRP